MTEINIETTVRKHIIEECLQGADESELTDSTPLMTIGILDSIRTIKLVSFLEDHFCIRLGAHETDIEYMGTIADIGKLVRSKLAQKTEK